jgi:inhibitor of cysteine peptidase
MKKTLKLQNVFYSLFLMIVIIGSVLVITDYHDNPQANVGNMLRFKSADDIVKAFENAPSGFRGGIMYGGMMKGGAMLEAATAAPVAADTANSAGTAYSQTNVQVEGVDEADIIKTDGEYIYLVANNKLFIAKAYPGEEAKIVSETEFEQFNAQEIFIQDDRLMLFGQSYKQLYEPEPVETQEGAQDVVVEEDTVAVDAAQVKIAAEPSIRMPYYYGSSTTTVKLYDISDKEKPELLRNLDFEGSYLTSRKIGDYAYFVINAYPHPILKGGDPIGILPVYKDGEEDVKPIATPTEIGYVEPLSAQNFITVLSVSMTDENEDFGKEVIAGNGQNVYASLENLYVAQLTYPTYDLGELVKDFVPKTVVTKFVLDDGDIQFVATGEAKGQILNQFSMDEFEDNFRIATTISGYENNKDTSTNNMYVLDEDLKQIGAVEGIAPGESIYSVRFMGERAYMVTFKHVDPLFVIDLSEPTDPKILGKLKIPGYSEYLHPYDATHLIGVGKEVDESIDADKVHTEGAVYYTAIQGVKLAIFDVSDVSNPIELYKEVIGDRGTRSPAEENHKAFLFDKEKGLLVLPVTVAELKEGQSKDQEGEFTFQGAYVYDVNLDDGFQLRGKVTHYDDDSEFQKSGYYFYGTSEITRSMYINDVLYTLSNKRLQLNDLSSLEKITSLDLGVSDDVPYRVY